MMQETSNVEINIDDYINENINSIKNANSLEYLCN